ncbi:MAG: PP2C family protein-serine/threonine phosphatase [Methylococcaceae bacterium]
MKLLIADDDLTSRVMLTAVTRKWGYESIAVEDGEFAWQALQKPDAPLLLLIDWEMPRLDGLALCLRIRQQITKNPPYIILLTSRGDTDDVVAGLEAGANNYIVKPFSNAELRARLQVGQRLLDLQDELKRTQEQLTFEREVIENIILKMRASKPFDTSNLRTLDAPVEKTSGDIMLSAFRSDNIRHILMGDFTGHGLMAAVAGPIVYDVFYTMTAKGIPIKEIAFEINRQLLEKMPTGLFLGAIFIELSSDSHVLSLWNCGMSDVLIYRNAKLWQKISSGMLALGIIKQQFEATASFDIEPGDRVYAYSDGITEVINSEEEEFGQDKFEHTLCELLNSNAEIEFLGNTVNQFRGEAEQFDDITLIELTC